MRISHVLALLPLSVALVIAAADARAQGDPRDPAPSAPEPPPSMGPGEVARPVPVASPPPPPSSVAVVTPPSSELPPSDPPEVYELDGEELSRDHFEVTMGFLVGQRSYTSSTFEFDEGTASSIGGGQLVAPFEALPFTKVTILGLRYDMRLVVSYVRMLAGLDFPFPTFRPRDVTGRYMVGGVEREVTVQSLSAKELRFGIGGEYPFKRIAPFIDIIGGVHWSSAEFAIDGQDASYSAVDFAFSARAGLRLYARRWFFASASGEIGLVGDIVWNADMSVGFAVP